MTTFDEVRAAAGGFLLRPQDELEQRLAKLINEIPEVDEMEIHCGQLAEVLYALGVDYAGALMVAVGLWHNVPKGVVNESSRTD